jgi:hypothetical protein
MAIFLTEQPAATLANRKVVMNNLVKRLSNDIPPMDFEISIVASPDSGPNGGDPQLKQRHLPIGTATARQIVHVL